jgi:protein TonB
MICYNVPIQRAKQAATRRPVSRPKAAAIAAAISLHLAVCLVVVGFVRVAVAPVPHDTATISMAFVPAHPPELPANINRASPKETPPLEAEPLPEPPPAPAPSEPAPSAFAPQPEPSLPAPVSPPPRPPALAVPEPAPPAPAPPVPASPAPTPPASRSPASRSRISAPPKPSKLLAQRHRPAPVPVTTPPTPGAAPEPKQTVIPAAWQNVLAAWLAAHKTYPDAARRQGEEGAVVLRFTADRSGRVLDVTVVRSAGAPALDAAAESMVRGATLPPFTDGMAQQTVTVTVQIRYTLN